MEISKNTKGQILSVLYERIEKWYPILQEVLKPCKGILPIFQVEGGIPWMPYLKSVNSKIDNGCPISLTHDVYYYPGITPFLTIKTKDGKHINFSDLFNVAEEIIKILKSEGFEFLEPCVRRATFELLLIVLESKDCNLPSLEDIKKRLRDNLDKFLQRALSNKIKVIAVAPIIGCKVDEAVKFDDGCIIRPLTEDDLSVMVIAKGLESFENPWTELKPYTVLVAEHEIDTATEKIRREGRYNEETYIRELHESFKAKTYNALLALRLCAGEPVGYSLVYHIDKTWTTPLSFRIVTEDPSPNYRVTSLYEISGRKSDRLFLFLFDYNKKLVKKDELLNTYKKISNLYSKVETSDEHEAKRYSHLLWALKYYSKAMDKFEVGWVILYLTNALEAICKFLNGDGDYSSANKIKRTLEKYELSLTKDEKSLIKKAYRARSEFIAHSPGSGRKGIKFKDIANKIDWMEKDYFYLCKNHDEHIKTVRDLYLMTQKIIQKLLESI